MYREDSVGCVGYALFAIIGVIILGVSMWLLPKYRLYSQSINGQANLVQQEREKKIIIEEAKAQLESAKLRAEAELIRAEGMAKSIEVENGKLTERYIQYLWVRNIDKMDGDKIYIPTEANLPILEAR